MNIIITLFRRQLIESRWVLGLCSAAFFGAAYLTTWMAQHFEVLLDKGEIGPDIRRHGVLRGLGGAAMDYSTTALEVCWWNHPIVVLTVLGWALTRGSSAIAGEIERGTIDLTLSRPVPRSSYLSAQVAFTVFGLLVMTSALIAGCLVGNHVYTLKAPPSLATLLRPATLVVTLGMAVYGYTLPFSAFDVVRWRATLAGSAITMAGLLALSLESWYEGYFFHNWLEKMTVFQFYAPVTVAIKGTPLAYNASILLAVFSVGLIISFWWFSRRDIPSNS